MRPILVSGLLSILVLSVTPVSGAGALGDKIFGSGLDDGLDSLDGEMDDLGDLDGLGTDPTEPVIAVPPVTGGPVAPEAARGDAWALWQWTVAWIQRRALGDQGFQASVPAWQQYRLGLRVERMLAAPTSEAAPDPFEEDPFGTDEVTGITAGGEMGSRLKDHLRELVAALPVDRSRPAERVMDLYRQLAMPDQTSARLDEAAAALAVHVGDGSLGGSLRAHRPDPATLPELHEKMVALIHEAPSPGEVMGWLGSGESRAVEAGTGALECLDLKDLEVLLPRFAELPPDATARALKAVADRLDRRHLPALEKLGGGAALARAAGEAAGRVREREAMIESLREDRWGTALWRAAAVEYNRLGAEAHDRGDHRGARVHFTMACRLHPDSALHVYNLANTMFHLGNAREAVRLAKVAIDVEPGRLPYYLLVVRGLARQGDHAALTSYLEGTMAQGLSPEIRGHLLLYTAAEAGTRRDFAKVLEVVSPGNDHFFTREMRPHLLARRGEALLELGRRDEARTSFVEALDLSPDLARAAEGMARLAGPAAEVTEVTDEIDEVTLEEPVWEAPSPAPSPAAGDDLGADLDDLELDF